MSKYTYLNMNGSHGMILKQIKRNSKVLELGCATGYMTKYMSENLGCIVHIVEIDKSACKTAAQYAYDWYCGDLEEDDWRAYYSRERKYDYILFADVLEHLKSPYDVLEKAVSLLKDDGKIIISIPNICHNDIIIKLFYDRFTYTDIGLLDNTHIHFWGLQDFADFVDKAGLKITDTKTVKFPTQGTEQRTDFRVDGQLMNLLTSRQNGEVYQYIFVCERK